MDGNTVVCEGSEKSTLTWPESRGFEDRCIHASVRMYKAFGMRSGGLRIIETIDVTVRWDMKGGRGRVAETCYRPDKNMRFRMSSQRSRACALEPGDACLCKKRGETIERPERRRSGRSRRLPVNRQLWGGQDQEPGSNKSGRKVTKSINWSEMSDPRDFSKGGKITRRSGFLCGYGWNSKEKAQWPRMLGSSPWSRSYYLHTPSITVII